jgi:hypothetical protein
VNSKHLFTEVEAATEYQPRTRTSEVLRAILTNNPGVETFSVERIVASIGSDRVEASLMMFSLPALVPVTAPGGMVALPTGALAMQLVTGRKQVKLPRFILNKSVSRRSLAVAIHAVLPILEAAERVVRPRWSWVNHPMSRRAIGLLVFLLAVAIAYPLFSANAAHAMSIFLVSLGMVEQDGLAVLIGVVAGVLSLVVAAASGFSLRAVRHKVFKALRKVGRRLGFSALAAQLDKRGYTRIARFLRFEWTSLAMSWDPEKRGRAENSTAVQPAAAASPRKSAVPASKTPVSRMARKRPTRVRDVSSVGACA